MTYNLTNFPLVKDRAMAIKSARGGEYHRHVGADYSSDDQQR